MIAKIGDPCRKQVGGLIYYLFGPGRREEHADPHLIAGWRHPAELEPPLRSDGHRDFRRLTGLLQQPHAALGARGFDRPVWHCSVRAAPEDRMLSDDEWAQIARDVVHRTALSPSGQDDDAVRWIAVRHGADHIHIVAILARQDGGRPRLSNERYRVREACRAAEEQYGLRRTAPGDRTAAPRPTRAEQEKSRRRGRQETPRMTLKRAVSTAAAGASSEREFFARLTDAGVLVRKRLSPRYPGEITGYSVALPDDTTRDGGPVWFSGGKLAADLTLPRLRSRWPSARDTPAELFTPQEQNDIWKHAARTAAEACAQVRFHAVTSPAEAADAAWATADTLHVAAAALGSQVLRQAADSYDRAARTAYGRIPRPAKTGNSLRRTARLLSTPGAISNASPVGQATLIARVAALAESVAELRQAQQHAAQSAAARQAAEHLHAALCGYAVPPGRPRQATRRATTAERIRRDFPVPPLLFPAQPSMPRTYRPPRPGPQPSRRPRGPTQ
jgi:hypothetical protein